MCSGASFAAPSATATSSASSPTFFYKLVATLVEEMGERVPRAALERQLACARAQQGRRALRRDARERHAVARRRIRDAEGRQDHRRRDGLQALRHLRLPGRPHRRHRARTRARDRHAPATKPRWKCSASSRRRPASSAWDCASGVQLEDKTDFLGYEGVDRRRPGGRAAQGRRGGADAQRRATKARWCSTAHLSMRSPAARWATRASSAMSARKFTVADTQKRGAAFSHIGKLDQGRDHDRRQARREGGCARAARPSWPTTRPRICYMPRCARCWARTSSRRARWWRPIGCASTSRTSRPSRRRSCAQIERLVNAEIRANAAGRDPRDAL